MDAGRKQENFRVRKQYLVQLRHKQSQDYESQGRTIHTIHFWSKTFTLQIVEMRFSFQACFIAISMVLGVNGDKSPPSCTKPYDKMTACNLICNMIHDSDATSAMKMLQTKMESLTLVIGNKPSSPQPGKKLMYQSNRSFNIPPPGIPRAFEVFSCPGESRREFD